MSDYDNYLATDGTGDKFPAIGACEFIIQGLTSGYVKIQYLVPKTNLLTEPEWADYPGLIFIADTYRKISLSEEGVYFRVVGVGNNANVYVRFRPLRVGVSLWQEVTDPAANVGVGEGFTPGVTGDFPTHADNVDGSISISSCVCILKTTDDFVGQMIRYDIAPNTSLALTDNSVNYVVVDWNSGSPIYRATTTLDEINFSSVIPVLTIYRQGTALHDLTWGSIGDGLASKLLNRCIKQNRFVREEYDGLMLYEYGTRNVGITEGKVWYGVTRATTPSFLSDMHLLRRWAHVAGVWTETTVAQYSNTQYDNGTNVATLGVAKYTVAWFFMGVDQNEEHGYYIMGNQYASVVDAEAAQLPTDLPDIIRKHAILVGRFIIYQGAATAVKIQSAFSGIFQATTITTEGAVIRQKIVEGTTGASQGSSVTYAHSLDSTKIIHISGTVEYSTGYRVPQEHQGTAGYQFSVAVDPTNVTVKNHATNSGSILSKPFKIAITYTE